MRLSDSENTTRRNLPSLALSYFSGFKFVVLALDDYIITPAGLLEMLNIVLEVRLILF